MVTARGATDSRYGIFYKDMEKVGRLVEVHHRKLADMGIKKVISHVDISGYDREDVENTMVIYPYVIPDFLMEVRYGATGSVIDNLPDGAPRPDDGGSQTDGSSVLFPADARLDFPEDVEDEGCLATYIESSNTWLTVDFTHVWNDFTNAVFEAIYRLHQKVSNRTLFDDRFDALDADKELIMVTPDGSAFKLQSIGKVKDGLSIKEEELKDKCKMVLIKYKEGLDYQYERKRQELEIMAKKVAAPAPEIGLEDCRRYRITIAKMADEEGLERANSEIFVSIEADIEVVSATMEKPARMGGGGDDITVPLPSHLRFKKEVRIVFQLSYERGGDIYRCVSVMLLGRNSPRMVSTGHAFDDGHQCLGSFDLSSLTFTRRNMVEGILRARNRMIELFSNYNSISPLGGGREIRAISEWIRDYDSGKVEPDSEVVYDELVDGETVYARADAYKDHTNEWILGVSPGPQPGDWVKKDEKLVVSHKTDGNIIVMATEGRRNSWHMYIPLWLISMIPGASPPEMKKVEEEPDGLVWDSGEGADEI